MINNNGLFVGYFEQLNQQDKKETLDGKIFKNY